MKRAALAFAWSVGLLLAASAALASPLPPAMRDALPQAQLRGEATLRIFGFALYDARLWALPAFDAGRYAEQPFVLELQYRRPIAAESIAERSILEMRRLQVVDEARALAWRTALLQALRDVRPGDRLGALHLPGRPVRFYFNDQHTAAIDDAAFARPFFGIWLAEATRDAALRDALLDRAAGRP